MYKFCTVLLNQKNCSFHLPNQDQMCRMSLILHLALLIGGSDMIVATGGDISMSKFYEDSTIQEYNCSVSFAEPMFFDCACITGLWILYQSCVENVTIAADDTARCMKLAEAPVSKAVQIVHNRKELAVVRPNGKVTMLKPETVKIVQPFKKDWTMVTGSNWTLIDTSGTRICVAVMQSNSYCFFAELEKLQITEVDGLQRDCDKQFDYFIEPQRCVPIGGKSENICESKLRTSEHTLVKREATEEKPESTDEFSIPDDDDEDFLILQNQAPGPVSLIADEILDYMNTILNDILDFEETVPAQNITAESKPGASTHLDLDRDLGNASDPSPLNTTYSNPPYEFLEIAKRITLKTCSKSYVRPRFLDLAVATFIQLQQVQFKFRETSFKPPGFRRVLQYLRKCEESASKFEFVDNNCDGRLDGNYTAFNQTIELTVTSDYVDFNRDPVIETVWKIFYNAHSYCYPFFEKKLDHHRFTTWMIPLFQNQINDIWTSGKTTEQFFNGIFGNQVQVQENLAYCAISSRLESSYPFDLPRPARVDEYGPSLINGTSTQNSTTAEAAKERRKRGLDYNFLKSVKFGNCLDASKPVLCPVHAESTINY